MNEDFKKPTGGYLSGLLLAFTTWSILPFRTFDWQRGKKHALSFLPLVGTVLAIIFWLWTELALWLGMHRLPLTLLSLALVLLYTGGIHVDGLLDVSDAVASHKDKKDKLVILADPQIGAFAVIKAITWLLIYVALFYELHYSQYMFVAAGFIFSRMAAVITTKVIAPAKPTGMLASLLSGRRIPWPEIALFTLALFAIGVFYVWEAITLFFFTILWILWYWHFVTKQFGGITGDTTGFFIVTYETIVLFSAALITWIR